MTSAQVPYASAGSTHVDSTDTWFQRPHVSIFVCVQELDQCLTQENRNFYLFFQESDDHKIIL